LISLFNKSTNEKIAYLDDLIIEDTIQITRKINGEFTLSFEIMEDDLKTIYLDSEGYILCNGYYFDIKYIEKEHSDTLTYRIECEHVSYRLIESEVEYYTYDGTPSQILANILSGTEFSTGEIESTDIITFAVYEETNKLGLVQKLANLLELEIDYNNFSISLKNTIGINTGFAAVFGKNLKGIRKIIDRRSNITYYHIDLVELKNHTDYVEFKDLENVGVGDTIRIIDKAMNIDVINKVVKRSYNPIKSINSKLEIANSIELLTDKVTKIQRDTLAKGKTYHGIKISPDTGFESIRRDKMARGIFNSDTLAFQKGDGTGENWTNAVYFDVDQGEYVFNGKLSSDVAVSNTVITESLYAENGVIARLTVDMLETSNKVERYLNEDASDMSFKRVYEQYDLYITASVKYDEYDNPLSEQLTTKDSNPVFWADETHTNTTLTDTGYPVMVYQYDEVVKMQISFEADPETGYYLPIIQLGQGDGVTDLSSKAYIRKGQTGVEMTYFESNTGNKRKLSITDDGVIVENGSESVDQRNVRNIIPTPFNPTTGLGDVGDIFIEYGEDIISDEEGSELVGGGDTSLHTHDDRYYTETEIDDTISSLIEQTTTYLHNQSTTSDIWNIEHNLDKYPSVTVVDSGGSVVEGEVDYIDRNNITLAFSGAFSGRAYLN
jgi:hypothetical protein